MHKFVRNFITEWRRLVLPFSDEIVVVAVSGGADSVSLLLALYDLSKQKKLRHRIVAAHFNHKLRGVESDADEEYVRHLTTKLGVELAVGHGIISSEGNLEQNARDARYTFLTQTAENLRAFAVLTGHTVNDQAETFLINLIRGSGVEGLSGMRPVRPLNVECGMRNAESSISPTELGDLDYEEKSVISLVRPLLTWAKRIDTESFCHDREIEYRYDTMNEDTAFKRVHIRKILLPLLADFNPKIIETLAQTATLMANACKQNTKSEAQNSEYLLIKDLKPLDKANLHQTIRNWLGHHRGNTRSLQLIHIEAVGRLILSSKSGRVAELPGARVTKTLGKLSYEEN